MLDVSLEKAVKLFNLNFIAYYAMVKLILPKMVEQKKEFDPNEAYLKTCALIKENISKHNPEDPECDGNMMLHLYCIINNYFEACSEHKNPDYERKYFITNKEETEVTILCRHKGKPTDPNVKHFHKDCFEEHLAHLGF